MVILYIERYLFGAFTRFLKKKLFLFHLEVRQISLILNLKRFTHPNKKNEETTSTSHIHATSVKKKKQV